MPKEYAVAISYPGAHRTLVHTIANHLSSAVARLDGAVFLDLYDRIKFVGKIDDELEAVYRDQCDFAVAFHAREYFESEWCKTEWAIMKHFMVNKPPGAPKILLFQLDRSSGERVPGYVTTNAQTMTAEQIARLILEKMNVTPWITDARYARKKLTAMMRDRVDWQLEHRIRDASTGAQHAGPSRDDWIPLGLAELCRGRNLSWPHAGNGGGGRLPANIICLCGPNGAGKSVLLLRAIASAGTHDLFPETSWILDFSNNKDVCLHAREFSSLPATELKRFLKNQIPRDGTPRHVFLGIDGLDSSARHLSVRRDEMTAPVMSLRALRSVAAALGELSRDIATPLTFTVVVTLNAPRPAPSNGAAAKHGTWAWMYEELARSGTLFADLEPLPPVDDRTFREIYDLKLSLRDSDLAAMTHYICGPRDFLRLPLFLDAASWLVPDDLSDATTRVDFLRLARKAGRASEWPNEIDQLVNDLERFLHAILDGFNGDGWLKTMLQREWTGGWLELLTEAMARDAVAGAMQQLMHSLLDEKRRWEMSASYALSNVLTALCEARRAPRLQSAMRYYNLRRATLDGVVFGAQSVLFGVDCSGSSLNQVKLEDGCRFIATDFTMCTWDSKPDPGAPAFVECSGLWEPETKQS